MSETLLVRCGCHSRSEVAGVVVDHLIRHCRSVDGGLWRVDSFSFAGSLRLHMSCATSAVGTSEEFACLLNARN
jgi:hypothetical protein